MNHRKAFTVIELLVVIVIIGIIASLTYLVWQNIRNNAIDASLRADVTNAAHTIDGEFNLTNGVAYLTSLGAYNNGEGIVSSSGNTFTYTYNNSSSPVAYCVSVSNGTSAYMMSSTIKNPAIGTCGTGGLVTSGLVLYLDAGQATSYPGSGTKWYDLSGSSNTGTLMNGVAYSTSTAGILSFDGVDDYVINSSTTGIPVGSSNRTIEFWVYPKSDTNMFTQLGTGGGGNQVYIVAFYNQSGTRFLFTDGINGANNLTISGTQLPTLNAWNHIVFGNSGQSWFYYVNGVSKASGTLGVALNTVGQKYLVGKRDDVVQNQLNGNIGQFSVYNKALTSAEITQNFNASRSRYGI